MSDKKHMNPSEAKKANPRPKKSDLLTTALVNKKVGEIINHAITHNLIIDPLIGCSYYADNILLLGNCACVPERKECPCKESLTDIEELGRCRCRLYWKDLDTFLKDRKGG